MRTTLVRTKPILRAAVASLAVLATVGFASPTDIQAQQGQIIGTVTNATTGGPISEVQVFIEGQNIGALSRADGRFLILNVPAGSYELTASRIGFASSSPCACCGVAICASSPPTSPAPISRRRCAARA